MELVIRDGAARFVNRWFVVYEVDNDIKSS